MTPSYLVVDPALFSANYNFCLLSHLARNGAAVVYATTRFPYEGLPDPPRLRVIRPFFLVAWAAGRITTSAVVRRALRALEYPLDWVMLLSYVLIRRITLVHVMWAPWPAVDRWVIRTLRLMGRKVVYTAHNPFPQEFKPGHVRSFTRIYQQVDHVIALSEYTRREIVDRAGISAGKISVIPHGDYGPLFAACPANQGLLAQVRRRAAGRSVISFLGHIRPYKGLEYFIDSLPLIRRLQPETFFVIAGSILAGSKEEVEARLDRSCGAQNCILDVRYLPLADLQAYVSATDVLVQPYVTASQSGSTAMAYAAGIPVVSTRVGGLSEMIEDGVTGYLVLPRDAAAIATAVARCLEGDTRAWMARNARQLQRERYGWEAIAAQTLSVYKQVTGT